MLYAIWLPTADNELFRSLKVCCCLLAIVFALWQINYKDSHSSCRLGPGDWNTHRNLKFAEHTLNAFLTLYNIQNLSEEWCPVSQQTIFPLVYCLFKHIQSVIFSFLLFLSQVNAFTHIIHYLFLEYTMGTQWHQIQE